MIAAGAALAVAVGAGIPAASALDTQGSSGESQVQSARGGSSLVVRTDKGKVRGVAKSMVTSFLGIPYAAPPVGNLRWKAPKAAPRWWGIRDASSFGPSCVQGTGWDPGYEEPTLTEDCLYINVYRPSGKAKNLPVLVWNHGGGNTGGAGRDTNPDKFVTRSDVVFVTFNYRLGAMGYLDTLALERKNRDGAAGNFGILDQQAALRWVQRNIKAFGGDPRSVTLAGQSAGASNTCVQMASPGGKNLFKRAILHSGGCSARTPEAARASGDQFAAELGCTDEATQVACLRGKSPAEVLAAQTKFRQSGAVFGNAVVPTDPAVLLRERRLTNKPVIVGGTSDESQQSVFGAYDYKGNPITEEMLADLIAETYPDAADEVAAAYPAEDYWSPSVAWGAIQSDARACRDQTLRDRFGADTRTWAYEFAEKDGPPFTSIWRLNVDYPFGATHVNDLGYLWDYLGTSLPFSSAQVDLSNQMISYWSTFVERGKPNPAYAPRWPRFHAGGWIMQFQAPSGHVVRQSVIDEQHNCALWDEVSPLA
jgi:para-nitrobenzyl esterase